MFWLIGLDLVFVLTSEDGDLDMDRVSNPLAEIPNMVRKDGWTQLRLHRGARVQTAVFPSPYLDHPSVRPVAVRHKAQLTINLGCEEKVSIFRIRQVDHRFT